MPNLPIPIRAALGLAATAVEEARKLPETLPQAVTTVPVLAVGVAMQASMRVQQRIAALAAKGDQVISEFRGTPSEPPAWATFDDDPSDSQRESGSGSGSGSPPEQPQAAFDRIDYDATGFVESDDDDEQGRWDAVGAGAGVTGVALGIAEALVRDDASARDELDEALAENAALIDLPDDLSSITDDAERDGGAGSGTTAQTSTMTPTTTTPTKTAAARRGAAKTIPTKSDPSSATPVQPAPVKKAAPAKAPAKNAPPAKKAAAATKTGPTRIDPVQPELPAAGPAKKAPAKKRAPRASEPLEVAAKKAQRAKRPTPSTMAAEIVQAHQADSADE